MTTHWVTLNALAPSVYSGELRRWERPEGAELLNDRFLPLAKSSPPTGCCACSSFHALWLSLCFPTLTFCLRPAEIVTRVFIEPSRTHCTKQSRCGQGRLAPAAWASAGLLSWRWQGHFRKPEGISHLYEKIHLAQVPAGLPFTPRGIP